MSEFRPTPSQAAAIDTRGCAVLVSAGAGSGKTRVLTQRLMGYICSEDAPAELDSFLIITYTRAAAGELRGRISEELSKAVAADPGNRRLRRQSALCRRAQIGTIHSFCAALLRENCHLAGLTPDFKIADEERAAQMKNAALGRVLEKRYEKISENPGFALLADTVGAGRDDRRLAELTLTLYEKMQCHARPEQWARDRVMQLRAETADAGETVWGREILSRALETAEYWSDELDRLMADMSGSEKISAAYMQSFAATADAVRELCRCLRLGWDRARACLPVPFPKLGALRNSPDAELSERLKARRAACKKAMEGIADTLHSSSERLLADMARTEPAMTALLELTLDFEKEYSRAKSRAGLVDYADLEHMTARLLTDDSGEPTELARLVSQRYTEIMVDEYQDVSRVQEVIFRAISRDGKNLFMVGDVKQSIYRFRLADPRIFTEKYESYAEAASAREGQPRKILLQENFRSRREVLAAANAVFSLCMSKALGDLDYGEGERLVCGAAYDDEAPVPEIMLLELPKSEEGEESPDKAALEARMTALKIRSLIDSGVLVTDGGRKRPLEYGDIAILLRSANTVGGVYRRELSRAGIPVEAGQSGGFFKAAEISAVTAMLAIIDNPRQDIPLIAALRAPAVGFTPDELSAVRLADGKADMYGALCKRAEEDERCRDFLQTLNELRAQAADIPVRELVWRIMDRFDMLAVCSAMSDGELRRMRLFRLAELAEDFEASGYRGLHSFVLWLKRLADKGQEPALGAQNGSVVQIMSVHRSKGLEFPVVFLCDAARRFNKQDSRDTVLVHPELGLGPKVTDLKRQVEYPSLARNAIKLRLERELLSEEMRLLYVALTRPKERLYITAALKKPEETLSKAAAAVTVPMEPEVLAQAGAPIDWLLYAHLADGGEHLKCSILSADEEPKTDEEIAEEAEAAADVADELRRRLAFEYPRALAQTLPSKVTATELKDRAEPDEDARELVPRPARPFRLPDFARQNRPPTGTERGTATHLVLQYMDFTKGETVQQVMEEIERLRQARFISDRDASAVDAAAIARLFASPLGKRLLSAEKLRREFKFSLLCDAGEIFHTAEGEQLLLQGVIDCYIEEPDGLVIVDYKTDRVKTPEEISARAAFYSGQIAAYARALERIEGKPVKECVLYFLAAGKAVNVPVIKS